MKKCTMSVDKIYNENLPEESRVPACVSSCPAGARSFGDLNDPASDVSLLSAARDGFALMPEQGTGPVNRYLPPRPKKMGDETGDADDKAPRMLEHQDDSSDAAGLLARWVDKILTV